MGNFAQEAVEKIRHQVGKDEVILGLSGGVDSSVTAALIHRAIGDQLTLRFRRQRTASVFTKENRSLRLSVTIWV